MMEMQNDPQAASADQAMLTMLAPAHGSDGTQTWVSALYLGIL